MPTESRSTVSYTPLSGADDIVRRMQALQIQAPIEIVAIGVSTGGPQALIEVIPYLPANLAVPVVIVQHMPQTFTGALATSLNDKSVLTVLEGQNGQTLGGRDGVYRPGRQADEDRPAEPEASPEPPDDGRPTRKSL